LKWRAGGEEFIECFCGVFYDVRCHSVEHVSRLMREHCITAGNDHVWTEALRRKFVGESFGLFVDENGELWKPTNAGWEWIARPRKDT
jgi:hypothetical protein